MKTFSKGQAVTFLQNWDSCGTIRIVDLTVHSCGKKQMILVDASGAKFEGQNFRPQVQQWGFVPSEVHPRMSISDADARAFALGSEIVADTRVRCEAAIVRAGYPEKHGYTIAVRRDIARLHEARIVREGVRGER